MKSAMETPRLKIRPPLRSDIPAIQKAAGVRAVADTMISIAHPYPEGEAEHYFVRQELEREMNHAVVFVIELKSDAGFCGMIELRDIDWEHLQGELSFWMAVEYWGQGYMSEAVRAVVRYGFESLELNRLYAYHMLRNPASGRILEKNGFREEGLLRQRVKKWGKFEDVALRALLKQDWSPGQEIPLRKNE